MKRLFTIIAFFTIVGIFAQSVGDYRIKSGFVKYWGTASDWEIYNGSSWVTASSYPNNFTTQVTVSNVTIKVIMNVDITQSGGVLACGKKVEISSGVTFTYSAGSILNQSNVLVKGNFIYNQNGGKIPGVTWDDGSTLEITGMTTTQPGGMGVNFKDVNINSPGMSTVFDITGLSFNDDLFITNTGSSYAKIDNSTWAVSNNITIESNGELRIKDDGRLTMTGTITNNGSASDFIIEANAASSGSLLYDGSVSGTYSQYISEDIWHLIGIPVNQGSGATLGAFNPATGTGFMRAYETANSDWGVYMYNESEQLNVGQGYEYWTTVNNTVSLTGTFNTGNVNLTMSSSGNQYNLLANPYPCAIDWESVADKTHADAESVYFYANTSGTNGYAVYNSSTNTGTYGATQYIPPFQGFFVEQTSATDMDFSNSNKAHPNTAFYKSVEEDGIYDRIRLQLTQDTLWSETVIVHSDDATNGYDEMVDTKMPYNNYVIAPEIYTIADDQDIMINGIGDYPAVVPLELDIIKPGIASITLTEMSDMLESTEITLEDRENNTFYTLDNNFQGISFEVDSAIISNRFFVHFTNSVNTTEQKNIETEIYSYNNVVYISKLNEDADVQIFNMLGQQVYNGRIQNQGMVRIELDQPIGYYIVKVQTNQNLLNKKLYID